MGLFSWRMEPRRSRRAWKSLLLPNPKP